ncbi:pseudouridine synthase [Glomus cerebriforme]|uniref:tRNA pseudouridine(55) synthase n=1 Tax=Glomus cerebriforme TaxID=658196 RepID=A0A397SHG2_9GLOM|nr:pseudouridine synthase [Glomus cerebriforme]
MIPHGLFAINKPRGLSSVTILNEIKKLYGKQLKKRLKLGHGGTLDPLASGVLVIGVNDGCKRLQDYIKCNKVYEAIGVLGLATDTYDAEGKIIATGPTKHITKECISQTINKFTGDIMQIPPLYSALKMDGRRLYEYAREGLSLPKDIQARSIRIDSLTLLEFMTNHNFQVLKQAQEDIASAVSHPIFKIRVECGRGTYIRSLVHDIGKELGSAAYVVELKRIQQGNFILEKNTLEWNDCSNLNNIFEALDRN